MSRQFGGFGPTRQSDKAKILVLFGLFSLCLFLAIGFLFLSGGSSNATTKTVVVEKEAEIKMVDVLVPSQKVEAGVPLEASMFRKESRPVVGLSNRVVKDYEEIKGYFSRSLIVPGQPLQRDYMTNVRPTSALANKIPDGFRAVTIRVNEQTSVEGFARPGSRVDVLWTSRIRGQPGLTVIVQNAQVLSAQRDLETNAKPGTPVPSTVTLLVSAADANKIQLAQSTGSLSLNLRGDADTGKGIGGATGSITIDDLLGNRTDSHEQPAEGVVKMRGKDGKFEEYILRGGKLTPREGGNS